MKWYASGASMAEIWLIDGYNVVCAWNQTVDWARDRDRLLRQLADFAALRGVQVMAVFDAGRLPEGKRRHEQVAGVDVVFSKPGETADQVIEASCYHLCREGHQVTVVTDDLAESRVVTGHGVLWMSALRFQDELRHDLREMKRQIKAKQSRAGGRIEERVDPEVRSRLEAMRHARG